MIWYKDTFLAKNSDAMKLYEEAKKSGDYKKLDAHIKTIRENDKNLIKRYATK